LDAAASSLAAGNARVDAVGNETCDQLAGLRRAVIEYHSAVFGHDMLIGELEARMRRVEQHLNLPTIGAG
jgi:hypothetical protein